MTSASPATVFLGICAILFGLASAYGVRVAMSKEEAPPPPAAVVEVPKDIPPSVPTKKIIIAKNNLPPYAVIKAEHLQSYNIPLEKYPEGGVSREETLLGRVTSRNVVAGTAISERDVFELGKVPTLEDKLQPGETAMTIPVGVTSSVAGYLHPDAHVNISLTVAGVKHAELKDLTTVTLLKNVRILATSENLFAYNPGAPKDMSNITVAVTPEVANKLIVAQRYGALSVTLANPADASGGLEDNGPEEKITPLELFGLDEEQALIAPEIPVTKMDVWHSTSRHERLFSDSEVREAKRASGDSVEETPEMSTRAKAAPGGMTPSRPAVRMGK